MQIGHNGGPSMDSGWVAIARSIRNHPVVGFHLFANPCDANRGATQPALAWIDLIMECRYEAGTVVNGGRRMSLQPGQLVGAISWLASRWNWTPKAVRVFIDKLVDDGMISHGYLPQGKQEGNQEGKHRGKQAAIITVCNYSKYQIIGDNEGQIKGQSEGPIKGQQYKDNTLTKESPVVPLNEDDEIFLEAFRRIRKGFKDLGLKAPNQKDPGSKHAESLMARLREHAKAPKGRAEILAVADQAVLNISRSKLCRGLVAPQKPGERPWTIDFFDLLDERKFGRLITGRYGNGAHAMPVTTSESSDNAERAAREYSELWGFNNG